MPRSAGSLVKHERFVRPGLSYKIREGTEVLDQRTPPQEGVGCVGVENPDARLGPKQEVTEVAVAPPGPDSVPAVPGPVGPAGVCEAQQHQRCISADGCQVVLRVAIELSLVGQREHLVLDDDRGEAGDLDDEVELLLLAGHAEALGPTWTGPGVRQIDGHRQEALDVPAEQVGVKRFFGAERHREDGIALEAVADVGQMQVGHGAPWSIQQRWAFEGLRPAGASMRRLAQIGEGSLADADRWRAGHR